LPKLSKCYVNWIWCICRNYFIFVLSLFSWVATTIQDIVEDCLFPVFSLCHCDVNRIWSICRDYVKVMLSRFSWFSTGIQNLVKHYLIPILSLCQCYVNYPSQFWSHRVLCELDLKHMQRLCKSYVISIFMVSHYCSKPSSRVCMS